MKNYVRTHFLFKSPLSANSLVQNIRNETMFGYVQCGLSFPDELKAKFSNFPPIFKNDIGENKRYWGKYGDICGRKRFVKTTATSVDIELQVDQRNYHTTFQLLLGSWTTVYKNSSICTIHTV